MWEGGRRRRAHERYKREGNRNRGERKGEEEQFRISYIHTFFECTLHTRTAKGKPGIAFWKELFRKEKCGYICVCK